MSFDFFYEFKSNGKTDTLRVQVNGKYWEIYILQEDGIELPFNVDEEMSDEECSALNERAWEFYYDTRYDGVKINDKQRQEEL